MLLAPTLFLLAALAGERPPLTVGPHLFHRRELANGLRAVFVRDERERATVFVVVGAGNRDESAQTTGLAHLVEHALFTGTPRTGPDEHERRVKGWGGESNAYTREDYTLYYGDGIPLEHLDELLAMEADRLVNLALEEAPVLHERERLRVEEAHTYQPSEGRTQALEAAFFRVHPYRFGLRDARGHTRAPELPVSAVREFYERWYHPGHTCVLVVGPLEPAHALDAIERAFGALPRGPERTPYAIEPRPQEARTERLPSDLPRDRVELCWLVPEISSPERLPLEIFARWLGRLELEGGEAVEASAGGRVDRDLFRVAASGPTALEGLRRLMQRALAEPIPAAELAEVKQLALASLANRPLRARPYFSLAASFAVLERFGQAELLAGEEAAIAALDGAAVQRAARTHLAPEHCVTVIFEGRGGEFEPLPQDAAGLTRAAREAADAGDRERAIAAYTALLKKHPNRMNTVIYLAERGMLRLDGRDFDGAIADFEQALAVVDYPAVRDMLEEAHARKRAASRGNFGEDAEQEEPRRPEPSEQPSEASERAEPRPGTDGSGAAEAELQRAQAVRQLLAGLEEAKADLERWRGLCFLAPVEPEFVDSTEECKLGGWYESRSKRLVVVLDKSAAFARGAQLHELFHALQDQAFDLGHLHAEARTTDEKRALDGLIEGEAMLAVAELLAYDFERHALLPADGPLERARFEKVFQYGDGLRFVRALRERGGWAAVNRAWGRPPRSSAEIFHPERHPAADPEPLAEPALEGEVVELDVLGEFELRWMLAEEPRTRALAAELGSELVADRHARLRLADGALRERWDLRFASAAAASRTLELGRPALERAGWRAELDGALLRLVR